MVRGVLNGVPDWALLVVVCVGLPAVSVAAFSVVVRRLGSWRTDRSCCGRTRSASTSRSCPACRSWLGAGLLTVALLEYPLSGLVSVAGDPFMSGTLAHLLAGQH